MSATIRRREFDLVLTEVPGGVEVSQAGFTYLARKWRLTPEVRAVIDAALEHGLQCLWQQGHPRSASSHHISFAFDRSPSSWVFVIGGEAGPPALRRVTFHKRLKGYFAASGLGWVWDWEVAGGKIILVSPNDLYSILNTLPLDDIRAGRLPAPAARGERCSQSRFSVMSVTLKPSYACTT